MALELKPEQILAVIDRIVSHIEIDKKPHARVGWAIGWIFENKLDKEKYGNSQQLIDMIANLVTENPKYIKEPSNVNTKAKDSNIKKNIHFDPIKDGLEKDKLFYEVRLLKKKDADYDIKQTLTIIGAMCGAIALLIRLFELCYTLLSK